MTSPDARCGDEPLTEEELRAQPIDALEARELMSTLLVSPAPGLLPPQIADAVTDPGVAES